MSAIWPTLGPAPRDELAAWSDAPLADYRPPPIPGYADPSPVGTTHMVGGCDVFVRRTAGPEGSPPTWYIHGLDGTSTNWDRLAAALSPRSSGYAPDLPGSGRSDPPPHGRYSIVGEADLLADLIAHTTPGRVHLVGNSRGGVVATFLAARHPGLVRSLTLVSPAVRDLRLTTDRGADARLVLVMLPGTLTPAERRLDAVDPATRARGMAAVCFGEPEALTDQDLAAAQADFAWRAALPWTSEATVKSLRSLIRAQIRPGRFSLRAAAGRIRVPVLVVWGTRDRLVDVRLARRTAEGFADHRLLVLPRTGHVAQMERPVQTARAMVALWQHADRVAARPPADPGAGTPGAPLLPGATGVGT